MTSTASRRHTRPAPDDTDPYGTGHRPGPLGRLGLWVTHHRWATALVWLLRLTGRAAWWTPRWLTRVLPTITFSHG